MATPTQPGVVRLFGHRWRRLDHHYEYDLNGNLLSQARQKTATETAKTAWTYDDSTGNVLTETDRPASSRLTPTTPTPLTSPTTN